MMPLVPNRSLALAGAFALLATAQPALAGSSSAPSQPARVTSQSSAQMVLIQPDTPKPSAQAPRYRPPVALQKAAGKCARSKPASNDADFSFQGFGNSSTRC